MPDQPPSAPPTLTQADVRHIAKLARLAPTDAQVAAYQVSLSAILGYIDRLRGLDLSGVEPMTTPLAMTGPLAPDQPGGMIARDALLAMAPATDGPFIAVPKVLGDGGGA